MTATVISEYVPDALGSLRDSFALHLDATRSDKTTRVYLAALDALIRHLEAAGMPTTARAVRREHVESYFARRRDGSSRRRCRSSSAPCSSSGAGRSTRMKQTGHRWSA
jgi:hypothetical protein